MNTQLELAMSFSELVEAYIAHGEQMMNAGSTPEMRREDDLRHDYVVKLREAQMRPDFPSPDEVPALTRLRAWESLHGVPLEERA